MISKYLQKVVQGLDLDENEAEEAMRAMMSGEEDELQVASFLTALRMKGEKEEEIAAFARVMRDLAVKIKPDVEKMVDVCGTGGDAIKTFNISTTTAFIVACFVPVAKHGNRAVTSKCGSADVLEALGVNLNMPPHKIKESIEKIGIGFMFAPLHHKAMKNVADIRRRLGMRTVFNILGPLTNPANATHQLMGVYDADMTERIARVMGMLGLKRALVVHGEPGLDEVSIIGKTKVSEMYIKEGGKEVRTYFIKPEDFGMKRGKTEDILGGSLEVNVKILKEVLEAKESGARRDIVLLNAAVAIFAAEEAKSIEEGLQMAEEALESGEAFKKLHDFISFSSAS
ncbi:MAG: anthranilate phosphoribosyltransferase [Candidatus Methanospirareceae archaeon]